MSNILKLSIAAGVLLLLGGVLVILNQDESEVFYDDTPQITQIMPADKESNETNIMEAEEVVTSPGEYVVASGNDLATVSNEKRVLFFHAEWCPTCRGLDKNIDENITEIPSNLSIVRLDFDSETELKKQYGVTLQHTLVQIDSQGNEIAQWSGSSSLAQLLERVQ